MVLASLLAWTLVSSIEKIVEFHGVVGKIHPQFFQSFFKKFESDC